MNRKKEFTYKISNLTIKPVNKKNWKDFELLFGPKGAYAGCWCMWWRLSRKEFESGQGPGNKQKMQALVDSGIVPGLLLYVDGQPCGWCSVAPREHFPSLERSPVLKRIDEKDVWSLVCFYTNKKFRGDNLGLNLIKGAIAYVKSRHGKIIEAYPSVLKSGNAAPVSVFMGIPSVLEKAGFKKVSQPSAAKIIMRYYIQA